MLRKCWGHTLNIAFLIALYFNVISYCYTLFKVQNSKFTVSQLTLNYKGADYTASCTVANPDIISGSGVVVLHYLQAITSRVALGTELAYQRGAAIPGGEIALLSAAAR